MLDINFPEWDRDLFLYLNSKHIPWLDPVMAVFSAYTFWIAICIALIIYLIYTDKVSGIRTSFFMLLGIGFNSLINNLIKIIIMRPRPGNEESLKDIMRHLEEAGTSYSFFSAHSSNSICLAMFTTLYFRNKYYGFIAFAWAMTVAYSRIYVGKHYPLDVMCGILFGLITGWFSYWLYCSYCRRKDMPMVHNQ